MVEVAIIEHRLTRFRVSRRSKVLHSHRTDDRIPRPRCRRSGLGPRWSSHRPSKTVLTDPSGPHAAAAVRRHDPTVSNTDLTIPGCRAATTRRDAPGPIEPRDARIPRSPRDARRRASLVYYFLALAEASKPSAAVGSRRPSFLLRFRPVPDGLGPGRPSQALARGSPSRPKANRRSWPQAPTPRLINAMRPPRNQANPAVRDRLLTDIVEPRRHQHAAHTQGSSNAFA